MEKKIPEKETTSEPIHVCIDRYISFLEAPHHLVNSVRHNPDNNPAKEGTLEFHLVKTFVDDPTKKLHTDEVITLSKLAIVTANKWQDHTEITIAFMNGTNKQKAQAKKFASLWLPFINLTFKYVRGTNATIRISFGPDPGSWSYIGTQCLSIPVNNPTMNFGWLTDNTPDAEWERVVVHEFGHALDCIHEHQNPKGNHIQWNKPAVYKYYEGPPNNWTKASVDSNIFSTYDVNRTQSTILDETSIMMYPIPSEFTLDHHEVGTNLHLSNTDKTYIATRYPR